MKPDLFILVGVTAFLARVRSQTATHTLASDALATTTTVLFKLKPSSEIGDADLLEKFSDVTVIECMRRCHERVECKGAEMASSSSDCRLGKDIRYGEQTVWEKLCKDGILVDEKCFIVIKENVLYKDAEANCLAKEMTTVAEPVTRTQLTTLLNDKILDASPPCQDGYFIALKNPTDRIVHTREGGNLTWWYDSYWADQQPRNGDEETMYILPDGLYDTDPDTAHCIVCERVVD